MEKLHTEDGIAANHQDPLNTVWKGCPGWLSRVSIQLLVLAQVMILQLCGFEPHMGLCAGSVKPAWYSLSLSLSLSDLPPPLMPSVSLTINKLKKKRLR